jgi:hypothetical protein
VPWKPSQPFVLDCTEKPRSIYVTICFFKEKSPCSTLALLVARVGAEHADYALAADDLAVAAHLLD